MLTYRKDPKITYTQMAMWIDNNAYTENCDIEKMYIYIYHLSFMLSKKNKIYTDNDDCDRFSLYMANRVLARFTSPNQFVMKEDGTPKVSRIKSVLNYLKNVIHLYKIDYQNKELFVSDSDFVTYVPHNELGEYISGVTDIYDRADFEAFFNTVDRVIYDHLKGIPYKRDSAEWYNIYMSCILSLINTMTLPKEVRKHLEEKNVIDAVSVERAYTKLRYEPPILFHLDDSMSNYIRVLVNEIKHKISSLLSSKASYYISSDAAIKGVIISSVNGGYEDEYK
jgi:hypothetical protein